MYRFSERYGITVDQEFTYGPEYLERTKETALNPFWLDIINSLQTLQCNKFPRKRHFINNTNMVQQ